MTTQQKTKLTAHHSVFSLFLILSKLPTMMEAVEFSSRQPYCRPVLSAPGSLCTKARAQLISRRKMSNFTAVFGKECQISWKFHGRLSVVLGTRRNHLHALIHVIRSICVINVKKQQFKHGVRSQITRLKLQKSF